MASKRPRVPIWSPADAPRPLAAASAHLHRESGNFQCLPPGERFWSQVTETDYCWEWNGTHDAGGYGRFALNGTRAPAHRVAWFWDRELAALSDIAGDLHHVCLNPSCVRPSHLVPLSPADHRFVHACGERARRAAAGATA